MTNWHLFINYFPQYCLPDCEEILYSAKVSAAPFHRCDFRTIQVNPLCNLATTDAKMTNISPMWGAQVIQQYRQVILLNNVIVQAKIWWYQNLSLNYCILAISMAKIVTRSYESHSDNHWLIITILLTLLQWTRLWAWCATLCDG